MKNKYLDDYLEFCFNLVEHGLKENFMDVWNEEYSKFPSYSNYQGNDYSILMEQKYKKTYENSMNRLLELSME